mmetsp:Transcript_160155/g.295177  ORF Transcript_160155/g.295177 Transcript_160155/m.295177 type:complete len:223 (+) Transcript_160155:84-752(+)
MGGTCCQAKREDQGENLEFNEGETANRRLKKCLTHEEFVATLASGDKHAKINMDLIEMIMFIPDDDFESEVEECQPKKKVKDRKLTGFVTKDMVEAASARQPTCADAEEEDKENRPLTAIGKRIKNRKGTGAVSKQVFADAEEEDKENRPLTAIGKRIKNRKGTGAVSKQKLLEVLDDMDDDEEEAPKPAAKESKIKQRKNTGFVTKEKLRKLLATLGEDEE